MRMPGLLSLFHKGEDPNPGNGATHSGHIFPPQLQASPEASFIDDFQSHELDN